MQRTGHGSERPFFAFKLHQFISGAGRLYGTIEAAGLRTLRFDGQQFDPTAPKKRLYAFHFCRNCGQEFHPVKIGPGLDLGRQLVVARDIEDVPASQDDDDDDEQERFGFLMPEPEDEEFRFEGRPEDYPESWTEPALAGSRTRRHDEALLSASEYQRLLLVQVQFQSWIRLIRAFIG
jgi:hypothetical protein